VRFALDTNVLAYAEGVNGPAMAKIAWELIARLHGSSTFLPAQVVGELFHLLVRKAEFAPKRAQAALMDWQDAFPVIETSQPVILAALDLAVRHRLRIWDSLVLSAAASANCRLLLSEDLHDGFTWSGVTVVNPFAPKPNALLAELLDP
jgi:predicted nucleic acid-binding protein